MILLTFKYNVSEFESLSPISPLMILNLSTYVNMDQVFFLFFLIINVFFKNILGFSALRTGLVESIKLESTIILRKVMLMLCLIFY